MERAKKGEAYWTIHLDGDVTIFREEGDASDEYHFKSGNYFNTKEQAEVMARKLRAVLNGADVIEMPTAKETLKKMPDGIFTGWEKCYEFLKSKIVK